MSGQESPVRDSLWDRLCCSSQGSILWQQLLPLLSLSLGLQEILLWPLHFTVAEDDISKAVCANQVAASHWELDSGTTLGRAAEAFCASSLVKIRFWGSSTPPWYPQAPQGFLGLAVPGHEDAGLSDTSTERALCSLQRDGSAGMGSVSLNHFTPPEQR